MNLQLSFANATITLAIILRLDALKDETRKNIDECGIDQEKQQKRSSTLSARKMKMADTMMQPLHPPRHWKYAHDSVGISKLLAERELRGNGHVIDTACQDHGSLVTRLACESVLDGHGGCVNHLRWNRNGSLLASGSDDHQVIVWDYSTRTQKEKIATGHAGNIFAVCFVPETNDHIIASGMAMAFSVVRMSFPPCCSCILIVLLLCCC